MREIGTTGSWAFLLWVACTVGMTAGRMLLSVAAGTMRADVTDGEEHRSGNFMPSVIAGVYSLFDKGMSSICAMIATEPISLVMVMSTQYHRWGMRLQAVYSGWESDCPLSFRSLDSSAIFLP